MISEHWVNLLYLALVAILVVPAAIMLNRRSGATMRNIAIWLAIAVVVALLYRFLKG